MKSLEIPWFREAARSEKLLVGVSGGLDSMALLHLANAAGFSQLIVCCLNHHLRGAEAAEEQQFVKQWAEKYGYQFEGGEADVRSMMTESAESLETAARRARHQFFARCARKHRCSSILLGHHADDQAETVLWNLMRGSFGCRGMEEQSAIVFDAQKIQIFRPLLSIRKATLENWMQERQLEWREDASNKVNDVVRNRIRNEAMPLLAEIAKRDISPLFARAAKADSAAREIAAWALEKAEVYDPQGRLHLGAMRILPLALQIEAIRDLLRRAGIGKIDFALLERCVGILDVSAGSSVNLAGDFRLRRKEGRIFVDKG